MTSVVLVPGVLALLPEYASLEDPVPDLRAACLAAVGRLSADVEVLADEQGRRVAEHLLGATPARHGDHPTYLAVANGSARRSDTAPGYLDERAVPFDDGLGLALRTSDREALLGLDHDLARELWASTAAIPRLAAVLPPRHAPQVDFDDDPFGVQYWVISW